MAISSQSVLRKRFRRWSEYSAVGVFVIGVCVLLGWTFDIRVFIHPFPALAPMNPTAAILFIIFCLIFFTQNGRIKWNQKKYFANLLSVAVLLVSIARLLDWRLGTHFNLDAQLFPEKILKEATNPLYSRLSPVVAVSFLFIMPSLLLLNYENKRKRMPAHYLALVIAFVGLTVFLGYIYNIPNFYGSLKHVTMAIHTSVCFLLIPVAILGANPDKGLMKGLTSEFAGSILARRLIPFAIIMPVLFGVLRLYLHVLGVTDMIWLIIAIVAIITSFLSLIFINMNVINKRDRHVRELNADLERRVDERTAEIEQKEKRVQKLAEELRKLVAHVQKSREEERKYVAREIHDELGQRLTALKIDVAMMKRKLVSAEGTDNTYIDKEFNTILHEIDNTLKTVKKIATHLRPEILDHLEIVEAVKWQGQQFENITGIPCAITYNPKNFNLDSAKATAVYRTVQEALTNIMRHAQATSVKINMEIDKEKLIVNVDDNGKGIKEKDIENLQSLGLIGVRERVHQLNGKMRITGRQNIGTTLSIEIPA